MGKENVLVVCPGRGTYNAPELGYLARHHAGHADLARFDAIRAEAGKEPLTTLDGMAKFSPSLHTRGDAAAPLIHAAAWLDFTAIDRDRFEVVAVTGNSMGWYTALACAGALSVEYAFRVADAMGANSQKHAPGGQMVLVLAGEDWRVDPALAALVERAVAESVRGLRSGSAGCWWWRAIRLLSPHSNARCRHCRARRCILRATVRSTRP